MGTVHIVNLTSQTIILSTTNGNVIQIEPSENGWKKYKAYKELETDLGNIYILDKNELNEYPIQVEDTIFIVSRQLVLKYDKLYALRSRSSSIIPKRTDMYYVDEDEVYDPKTYTMEKYTFLSNIIPST